MGTLHRGTHFVLQLFLASGSFHDEASAVAYVSFRASPGHAAGSE